jgi:hypothetical protein
MPLNFQRKNKLLQARDSVDPTNLQGMFGSIMIPVSSPQFNVARVKIWGNLMKTSQDLGKI